MPTRRNFMLGSAVALGRASSITAQAAVTSDFTTLEAALRAEASPGISIAITRADRVIYQKAFGLASSETGAAVTPAMLFRLGSTTKMFVAATLLTLVREGKLDLQAPVSRYITGLPACIGSVTAHQLLTHSAGLKDAAPMFGSHDDAALEANVRSWREDYCESPAGRQFKYSNPSYVLAGYLAQILSGEPFADAVQNRVLKPLGMRQSTFRPTMAMTYPLAVGHDEKRTVIRPAADYAGAWPAGSLFSNTGDLAIWAIALLDRGFAPELSRPNVPTTKTGREMYGYGLFLRGEGSTRVWEHTGDRTGYGSIVRLYPAQRVGVIMLGNWSSATFPRSLKAAAAALGLPE